ncbi:hypothetical protein [Pseudomonas aeruginosa]|uniref:hypothetical protein n=1 Tax=Pseudomonas aeruginosa TaxID=287 RepID=UPI00197BF56A|nr:hypothetical protein [Pseudomonas aeruginosa]
MNKANECTCPSGDGSLVHPCPAHPAVEQAGANVGHGHVFPRADGVKMRCGGPGLCSECTADASRARAALAQPSPPPHPASELDFSRPLETENGDPVKWICADVIEYKSARVCVAKDTGLVYSSPYIGLKIRNVMPEQAEAERPEGPTEDELEAAGLGYPLHKEEAVKLWYSGFRSEVITVLEAWEAIGHDIGMNPDKGELLDSLRYMLEKCEAHDAALARVAELTATRNRYGLDAHYFNKNLQRILRDFESFTPDELARSLIILAKVADEKVVAQAQHSVPEGWKLVPIEPTQAQLSAGQTAWLADPMRRSTTLYRAMLAAAPQPVAEGE